MNEWDFLNYEAVEPVDAQAADDWNETCRGMEAEGYILIEHHLESQVWDEESEADIFERLVVREVSSKLVHAYSPDEIQQANSDYAKYNWFSTVGVMMP